MLLHVEMEFHYRNVNFTCIGRHSGNVNARMQQQISAQVMQVAYYIVCCFYVSVMRDCTLRVCKHKILQNAFGNLMGQPHR